MGKEKKSASHHRRNVTGASKTQNGFFGVQPDFDGSGLSEMDKTNPLMTSKNIPIPNSSDILFLKRLLYLKASIDNEVTLNTFSVPLEQEKLRDNANQDELMINTNDINMR